MKTKILILLIIISAFSIANVQAQNGNATITQVNDGSTIEVSIFLRSNDALINMGFASFVINYNNDAMINPTLIENGMWDKDFDSSYADQFLVTYNNGISLSSEIGLDSVPATGIDIPNDTTLVCKIRFDIIDPTAGHHLKWNQVYTAVLDNHGIDITDHIVFTDPEDRILPVELSNFSAVSKNNTALLNWSTSSERNNRGFEIERNKTQEKNPPSAKWENAGFVNGNGTSDESKNYEFADKNLESGKYSYRLKQIDFNGNFEYFNLSSDVTIGTPEKFDLAQNYPNPFNPSTKINYQLPFDGKVSLKVFDISGKEVSNLLNDFQTAGYHTVEFNASELSSGAYFYKLSADINGKTFLSLKKMVLVK